MGFSDTLEFSSSTYASQISSLSTHTLLSKYTDKKSRSTRKIGASVGGIAIAAASHGLSLFGAAYSARQVEVLDKKRKIIKEELKRRGAVCHGALKGNRRRARDAMVGFAGTIAFYEVSHAFGDVVNHAVMDRVGDAVYHDFYPGDAGAVYPSSEYYYPSAGSAYPPYSSGGASYYDHYPSSRSSYYY